MKKISYKWIALSCTSLGALMAILNGGTLVIALPVIMKELHTNLQVVLWIIIGYLLLITILVPAIGRVADIIGRKMLFVGGFIVFTLGSFLCGLAQSGIQLFLYRLVQAVGGSLIIANGPPIITDAFPKNELGRGLGVNSMIISVALVIGPVAGGFLIPIGWRWIFFVNVPIGIIGSIWAIIQLKELDVLPAHQSFDWIGTLIFSSGMLAFLIALSFGGFAGWFNIYIDILFVYSIIAMALFILIEIKTKQPFLDMRLFKSRLLAFAYGSTLLNGIARGAVTFLLIFYFQGIKGYDPLYSAILLTPFALPMILISPVSGWLSDKYGSRELSSIGLLISAIGLIGFLFINAGSSVTGLMIWMLIMGVGSGLFFSPNTKAIMQSVPVDKRGIAAGVRTMMNNAGAVVSLALAMAIISSSITPDALQGLFLGTQVGSKGIAISEFLSGLRIAFVISFIFSLLGAFISYLRGAEPVWNNGD